jgi:hypothetical protein
MCAGEYPPQEPVTEFTGSTLCAPIFLPALRRPLGWRELDSKTLLLRAHGLMAAQCASIGWPHCENLELNDITRTTALGVDLNDRRQLPSSENFFIEEGSRLQVVAEQPRSDQVSTHDQSPQKKGRYSGWVLTATLVLGALQLAMFWVAISPTEVIETAKKSIRQWQTAHPPTEAAAAKSTASEGISPTEDRANWWTSWKQTSMTGILTPKHEVPVADVQRSPPAKEADQ